MTETTNFNSKENYKICTLLHIFKEMNFPIKRKNRAELVEPGDMLRQAANLLLD